MFCISYTRFGNRQNSRTHLIFQPKRPFMRVVSVPVYGRLKRHEVLKRKLRFGRVVGMHETGDPKYVQF